jgi:hypothetical protein
MPIDPALLSVFQRSWSADERTAFPSLQVPSKLEVSVAGVQGVVKVDASENGEDEGL